MHKCHVHLFVTYSATKAGCSTELLSGHHLSTELVFLIWLASSPLSSCSLFLAPPLHWAPVPCSLCSSPLNLCSVSHSPPLHWTTVPCLLHSILSIRHHSCGELLCLCICLHHLVTWSLGYLDAMRLQIIIFFTLLLAPSKQAAQLPEHWVGYMQYVIDRFQEIPCPRPVTIIAPGSLGIPIPLQQVCELNMSVCMTDKPEINFIMRSKFAQLTVILAFFCKYMDVNNDDSACFLVLVL